MAGDAKMAVSVLLNARDNLTGAVSKAKRMTGRLGDTISRIGRNDGFQRLRRSITRTGSAAKRLVGRVAKVGAGIAAAATGATLAVGHMVAKFASGADETAKLADQLGIGIKQLQQWRFVADRQGVSQETFNQSLAAFTKRVGEAQNGTGALTTQLKKSNPELLEQLQHTKDTSKALDLYLKAISQAPSATQKAALASAGFSRAGLAMIRITRDGADNIDQLRQRALDLGLVLDEKTARQAETFDDRLTDLKGSLTGVKNILGAQLLPVFTSVMDQITKWIVKNQGAVKAWAKNFAADLPGRLESMKARFDEVVKAAGRFIDKATPIAKTVLAIADHFGRMNTAVAGVAAIIAAPILAPLVSLTAALVGLSGTLIGLSASAIPAVTEAIVFMGGAIAANPIGAIITAIAGAAMLIYKYWGPISAFATRVWDSVSGVVAGAYDKIKSVLGFDPLAPMRPLWNGITQYVGGILDAVHTIVDGDVSGILDLFVALNPLNILKLAFQAAWSWLSSLDWSEAGKKLIGTLVNGLKSAAGAVKDALKSALSKARNLLPFSDAKEGPLSDLTKSGTRLPSTFAEGVKRNQQAVVGAVNNVMKAANEPLRRPVRGPKIVPLRAAGAKPRQHEPTVDAGSSAVALQTTRREARHTTERVVERERSPQSAAVALFGHAAAPGAGTDRRTPIGRVEVNAPISIQMGNNATPQDVGNAVRGELTNHDMWRTVQDIPED